MYPQIFSAAAEVDRSFLIILGVCVAILVLVTVLMLVFVWRFNHKRHPVAEDTKGSVTLEILWTVIPTIIVLGLFWTGWSSFKAMRNIPEDAMQVGVEARMWSWKFTYGNGRTSKDLVVPKDTPVTLVMTSRDVIHSLYIPALRLKWDTVPGMTTKAWFAANATGDYDILCAEYCGLKHADMLAVLKVVEPDAFESWLREEENRGRGEKLLEQYGCNACHSLDGSEGVGPSLKGISGHAVTVVLPGGAEKQVTADAGYLRRAIREPAAELVKGYDDMMPASLKADMPDEDLEAIVAYLLSLTDAPPPMPGAALAREQGCIDCHSMDGSESVGPTFKDLYGSKRKVKRGGSVIEVTADERYLTESITHPKKDIADGFEDMMPAYDALPPAQVAELVEWMKMLKSAHGADGHAGHGDAGHGDAGHGDAGHGDAGHGQGAAQ